MVLFAVLPFGVERAESHEPGHEPGAPKNPRLVLKCAVTTGIAAVIWGLVYWAIATRLIDFRAP